MKKLSILLLPIYFAGNLFAQTELPDCHCSCKKITVNNFTSCVNSDNYQSVWTAAKISESDIETHVYLPPDKQFFPGLTSIKSNCWQGIENQVKFWAMEFDSVFVVTGKTVYSGNSPDSLHLFYYKSILKGCKGDAIAFLVDSSSTLSEVMSFAISVDSLESVTGYDFFPQLDTGLQSIIESSFDTGYWPIVFP
jgi:DNA/RNA endonuclease G (NUC1)